MLQVGTQSLSQSTTRRRRPLELPSNTCTSRTETGQFGSGTNALLIGDQVVILKGERIGSLALPARYRGERLAAALEQGRASLPQVPCDPPHLCDMAPERWGGSAVCTAATRARDGGPDG